MKIAKVLTKALMIGIGVALCGCAPIGYEADTVPSSDEISTESAAKESTETGARADTEPEVPSLLLEQAVEINFDAERFPSAGILKPDSIVGPPETKEEDGLHVGLGSSLMSNGSTYWFKEYYEDMAQYCVKYRLYRSTPDFAETQPLYMTENTYWLNEFCGSEDYLYWVEFRNESKEEHNTMYVMQYDLKTSKLKTIADRECGKYEDILLQVSGDYLTWYDCAHDGDISMVVYRIPEQRFLDINVSETVSKSMPYGRLNVTNGGITYFSQDDSENIYVSRLQLDSGDLRKLYIGKKNELKEITGCYSTDRYMGYHTGYSTGKYYFYNPDTGKAGYFSSGYSAENELAVFSMCCDGEYLYLNDTKNHRIIRCDVEEGKGQCWTLPEGTGMHFHNCDGEGIQFEVKEQGQSMIIRLK